MAGFIDFIVEPTMILCEEVLTKIIEPLVSLRSSDTFPSSENSDSPLPNIDTTQESETFILSCAR